MQSCVSRSKETNFGMFCSQIAFTLAEVPIREVSLSLDELLNLTAICEAIFYKTREPRPLKALRASTPVTGIPLFSFFTLAKLLHDLQLLIRGPFE
jgi:hypothetical protein